MGKREVHFTFVQFTSFLFQIYYYFLSCRQGDRGQQRRPSRPDHQPVPRMRGPSDRLFGIEHPALFKMSLVSFSIFTGPERRQSLEMSILQRRHRFPGLSGEPRR